MQEDLQQQGEDVFSLWLAFNHQVESGKPATALTFTEVAKPCLTDALWQSVRQFVTEPEMDTLAFFQGLSE